MQGAPGRTRTADRHRSTAELPKRYSDLFSLMAATNALMSFMWLEFDSASRPLMRLDSSPTESFTSSSFW